MKIYIDWNLEVGTTLQPSLYCTEYYAYEFISRRGHYPQRKV
jgi:hypothetical protein